MAKEKKPVGRPKGSGKGKRGTPQPGRPRAKTKACPASSKPGHGTDWHCDTCDDTGEVSG